MWRQFSLYYLLWKHHSSITVVLMRNTQTNRWGTVESDRHTTQQQSHLVTFHLIQPWAELITIVRHMQNIETNPIEERSDSQQAWVGYTLCRYKEHLIGMVVTQDGLYCNSVNTLFWPGKTTAATRYRAFRKYSPPLTFSRFCCVTSPNLKLVKLGFSVTDLQTIPHNVKV